MIPPRAARLATLLTWLGSPPAALADDGAAEDVAIDCARAKTWELQLDGWSLRSTTGATLALGDKRVLMVTLYPGRTYRLLGCATEGVTDLDLLVYDAAGKVVARDEGVGREPVLDLSGLQGAVYIVTHVRGARDTQPAGAALSIAHHAAVSLR
jgi:hypothetical protein